MKKRALLLFTSEYKKVCVTFWWTSGTKRLSALRKVNKGLAFTSCDLTRQGFL